MQSFLIHDNVVKKVVNTAPSYTIDSGISFKNLDENTASSEAPFKIGLDNETPDGVSYASKTNNTFTGLTLFANSSKAQYKKTQFMTKDSKSSFTFSCIYDKAVKEKYYTVMAVKGTPDNYKINSDSLLYINQYYAETSGDITLSATIPYKPYKGAYVIIVTSNDGKIKKPLILDSHDHIHDYKLIKTVKATCKKEGRKIYKCSTCGDKTEKVLKKVAHKKVTDKAVKPTFEKEGKTKGSHCSVCKKVFVKQKTIAKLKPAKTSFKKLTAGKKKITLKWKKQTKNTTGYIIQYSTNKKFKKAKSVTVKKNKTVKKVIKKLKSKKKYYFRIRTYKKVGKKKYYSAWSKKKSITIK